MGRIGSVARELTQGVVRAARHLSRVGCRAQDKLVTTLQKNEVRYQPTEAVGTLSTLQGLLKRPSTRGEIARLLPDGVEPERFIAKAYIAAKKNPKLMDCTQESFLLAMIEAAECGLEVSGTNGDAWLVPYKREVKLQPGYRGLARLARATGEIARLEAAVVYEQDKLTVVRGSEPQLSHEPFIGEDRGEPIACYALAKLVSGEVQFEIMTKSDIEAVRQKSKAPESLMWQDFWGEGGKKTAFRRLAKWLPSGSTDQAQRYQRALEVDDSGYSFEEPRGEIGEPKAAAAPPTPAEQPAESAATSGLDSDAARAVAANVPTEAWGDIGVKWHNAGVVSDAQVGRLLRIAAATHEGCAEEPCQDCSQTGPRPERSGWTEPAVRNVVLNFLGVALEQIPTGDPYNAVVGVFDKYAPRD